MLELPQQLLERCRSVTAKRPKMVIDHILKYGFITAEELKERYGYNHPLAMRPIRRLDVMWQNEEIETYEKLKAEANSHNKELPSFVKEILERELQRKDIAQDEK